MGRISATTKKEGGIMRKFVIRGIRTLINEEVVTAENKTEAEKKYCNIGDLKWHEDNFEIDSIEEEKKEGADA